MEWMLPVLVLAIIWYWLQKKRPAPSEPKPSPDVRALLAAELERRSEAVRREGRYGEAQVIALKATWLGVYPKLGDDDPPETLDPNAGRHLRFVSTIWSRYHEARAANEDRDDVDTWLPYPKDAVRKALQLLLDVGEGTVRSAHVSPGEATPEVLEELRAALVELRDERNGGRG